MKDGVRKAIRDRQLALTDPVHAIREYRRLADSTPVDTLGLGSRSCYSGVELSD